MAKAKKNVSARSAGMNKGGFRFRADGTPVVKTRMTRGMTREQFLRGAGAAAAGLGAAALGASGVAKAQTPPPPIVPQADGSCEVNPSGDPTLAYPHPLAGRPDTQIPAGTLCTSDVFFIQYALLGIYFAPGPELIPNFNGHVKLNAGTFHFGEPIAIDPNDFNSYEEKVAYLNATDNPDHEVMHGKGVFITNMKANDLNNPKDVSPTPIILSGVVEENSQGKVWKTKIHGGGLPYYTGIIDVWSQIFIANNTGLIPIPGFDGCPVVIDGIWSDRPLHVGIGALAASNETTIQNCLVTNVEPAPFNGAPYTNWVSFPMGAVSPFVRDQFTIQNNTIIPSALSSGPKYTDLLETGIQFAFTDCELTIQNNDFEGHGIGPEILWNAISTVILNESYQPVILQWPDERVLPRNCLIHGNTIETKYITADPDSTGAGYGIGSLGNNGSVMITENTVHALAGSSILSGINATSFYSPESLCEIVGNTIILDPLCDPAGNVSACAASAIKFGYDQTEFGFGMNYGPSLSNSTVEGNEISGTSTFGIVFAKGASNESHDTHVINNDLLYLTALEAQVYSRWCPNIVQNEISGNVFGPVDPKGSAVVFCRGFNNTIAGNDYSNTGVLGFKLSANDILLAGCVFLDYGTSGNKVNESLGDLPAGTNHCLQFADVSGANDIQSPDMGSCADDADYMHMLNMLERYGELGQRLESILAEREMILENRLKRQLDNFRTQLYTPPAY